MVMVKDLIKLFLSSPEGWDKLAAELSENQLTAAADILVSAVSNDIPDTAKWKPLCIPYVSRDGHVELSFLFRDLFLQRFCSTLPQIVDRLDNPTISIGEHRFLRLKAAPELLRNHHTLSSCEFFPATPEFLLYAEIPESVRLDTNDIVRAFLLHFAGVTTLPPKAGGMGVAVVDPLDVILARERAFRSAAAFYYTQATFNSAVMDKVLGMLPGSPDRPLALLCRSEETGQKCLDELLWYCAGSIEAASLWCQELEELSREQLSYLCTRELVIIRDFAGPILSRAAEENLRTLITHRLPLVLIADIDEELNHFYDPSLEKYFSHTLEFKMDKER